MAKFDEFLTSLRNEFGEQGAGKPFEAFCKWFLENDPEWSKIVEKVWLWDDYPNKWQRQDLGTDLVFRDKEGMIWAVQAKCFSEHRTTTKADMNSFLADTARKGVDRRLWIQTTNKIASTAERTVIGQEKPIVLFRLDDFREAQLDYSSSFSELTNAKVKTKPIPEPHQSEAIKAVVDQFSTQARGQMIMACGTGKTFTTLWVKEAINAKTTLVLLPSLSLLSQTMREWVWAGNTNFEVLNVCSDKSVGRNSEDMKVSDAPFPVTSDPAQIATFLKKSVPKVIFCTYQSSPLIQEAQLDLSIPAFDLVIADEAHRCAGKTDAGFATVLDAEKIRSEKRLFTTATPRYFGNSVKNSASARDLTYVGMDNEAVFGPVFHNLTFGEAINRGLLTDYQVVIVGVDKPMVKEWIDEQELVALNPDEQTDAKTLAAKIGLIKSVKEFGLERIISFHSRVKGAQKFSQEFLEVMDLIHPEHRPIGEFLTDYVSGTMSAGERKEKIDRLKSLEGFNRGILSNSRCLAEGVDVPSLDAVAFIDPKGSQVEIIQAVGRAIRKVRGHKQQKKGTIVIPVFIEEGENPESSIEESNFNPVWDVLKALRAHDEVLAETLDKSRTSIGRGDGISERVFDDKLIVDLPITVDQSFTSALKAVLVEATTASWEFWFGLLESYKEREGHVLVPAKYKTDGGLRLGGWVSDQRKNIGALEPIRKQRLETLGFVWDVLEANWERGLSELRCFKELEGHLHVPKNYKTDNGFKLGNWVGNQRRNINSLDSVRKECLEALGFVWDVHDANWEEGFNELRYFKEREGNIRVPKGYKTEGGFRLNSWIVSQRGKKDSLSVTQIRRLNSLGFVWDPLTESWDINFNELRLFTEREGHARVPKDYITENGHKLGVWIARQRFVKASLDPDRIRRLDSLGFVWNLLDDYWEQGFNELLNFKEHEGHTRVPNGYETENGFTLGNWVGVLRKNIDTVDTERKQRLNSLGFVWDVKKEQWEDGFQELCLFKQSVGHTRVPKRHKTANGFSLGNWVTVQRKKVNSLDPEHKQRLEALGFVWDANKEAWEAGFHELCLFVEREGHSLVPARYKTEDGFALGTWVNNNRKNVLNSERKKRLDSLGFVWEPFKESWYKNYNELISFMEREGHSRVPNGYMTTDGVKLNAWIKNQRQKKDSLGPEYRQRLEDIGLL